LRRLILLCVIGLGVLSLNGCMMMGMRGMGGSSSHPNQRPGKTLVKELINSNVRITLEVPPPMVREVSTFSVRINETTSGNPVSGSKVTFKIYQIDRPSSKYADQHVLIIPEQEAQEVADNGVYQGKYLVEEKGVFEIVATVWLSGEDEHTSPLVITATQEVGHIGTSMDRKGNTLLIVLGGIGMALMMAFMVLGSHH
jgi:hypothetical protein